MHMLRLGIQAIEYVKTGRLTLPVPGPDGEFLREVRHGNFTLDEVIKRADQNERTFEGLAKTAPDAPDHIAINEWLLAVHRASLPAEC